MILWTFSESSSLGTPELNNTLNCSNLLLLGLDTSDINQIRLELVTALLIVSAVVFGGDSLFLTPSVSSLSLLRFLSSPLSVIQN